MAVPTKKQLEKWAEAYVRLWNEGDVDASALRADDPVLQNVFHP